MNNNPRASKMNELATLVSEVQRRGSRDLDATLAEIVDSATRGVTGAQYAGITRISREAGIRNEVATHPDVVLLDEVQNRDQDGPCVNAAWTNDLVRIDDLADEERWPRYRDTALDQTRIRSVLAYRVFSSKHDSAALNFFSDQPRAFSDASIELGFVFTTHTALAWGILRRDAEFRSALASRDVIGQAKGMLMERFGIDALQAFELLKRLSQEGNTPLYDIALRLTTKVAS